MALPDPSFYSDWRLYAQALLAALTDNGFEDQRMLGDQIRTLGTGGTITLPPYPGGIRPVWLDPATATLYLGNHDFDPPTGADLVQIDTAEIADAAIETAKLAELAVSTGKLANLVVVGAKIANAAIVAAKIGDLEVVQAKIADLAVNGAKIANAAITSAKIANLAVGAANIQLASIGSAQIANAAIGSAQIASAAVGTAQIANAAITNALIANAAVGNAQIQNAAITYAKIGTAEVDTLNLKGNSVTTRGGSHQGGPTYSTTSFQTILSYSFILDEPGMVILTVTGAQNYPAGVPSTESSLKLDGVPYSGQSAGAGDAQGNISMSAIIAAGAGSHTATFEHIASDDSMYVDGSTLIADGAMR